MGQYVNEKNLPYSAELCGKLVTSDRKVTGDRVTGY